MADVQIPKTYKAAVYDKPGSISTKVTELETPTPGPGEVLVKLTHSGVCHSDFGIMMNTWSTLPYPTSASQVGGHEGVGAVVALGPGADNAGVKIGDRVGIKWVSGICGNCPACLSGNDGVCFNCKISGYYTPGTFAQYALAPANYVTPIPEGLSSAAAAPMLCAGVTVYSALRKSGAQSGDWIAVLGAGGGLGHIACQIASAGIGQRVIGIDADAKEDLVKQSGAEVFIPLSTGREGITKKVRELTGGLGVQAVVVLTAANAAYASSVELLKFGGRLVCVGIPEGDPVPIGGVTAGQLISRAQSVIGVAVGNRREAIECLEMAARGLVKVHYKEEKLENLTQVFEDMHEMKLQGRVVLNLE